MKKYPNLLNEVLSNQYRAQMDNENYEEEIFMCGYVFQKQIPSIYD